MEWRCGIALFLLDRRFVPFLASFFFHVRPLCCLRSRLRINISHYQFPLEKASEQPEGERGTESIIDFVLCSRAAAQPMGKLCCREVILAGI